MKLGWERGKGPIMGSNSFQCLKDANEVMLKGKLFHSSSWLTHMWASLRNPAEYI